MSEGKHSPGPWRIKDGWMGRKVIEADSIGLIAILAEHDLGGPEHAQDDANAALLLSAPDLLAACKAFLEEPYLEGWLLAKKMARAAVAKAEGRAA